MHLNSLINIKAKHFITHRYILFFISVCCVFCGYAQQNLSQHINDVLQSTNIEEYRNLMERINESDIVNMPDSTLFDYYYLSSLYFSKNKEYEKSINNLVKAKEICETKLGINYNFIRYFDIIIGLGDTCEKMDNVDEALLWYEEGIIKGLSFSAMEEDETLQSFFNDFLNYSANIYEAKGYKDIAKYLRNSKSKSLNYAGSFDYARELFENAQLLYKENKCSEAIKQLEEAESILKKYGNEGKEMMQSLYRLSLQCYAKIGNTKKIDALLRTKAKTMFYDDTKSFLVDEMSEVIESFILIHHDIKTAEYYYQKLLKEVDKNNQKDLYQVEVIGDDIDYFQTIYSQIDSLENVKASLPILSDEWGISSLHQSNLLIKAERYDDANMICEQIYKMSVDIKEDPQNLHWNVLDNLVAYHNQNNNLDKTVQYLEEQLAWLDSKNITLDAEERGWIYYKLVTAYLNGKQYKESRDMLTIVEKILLPIYGDQSMEYAMILHDKGRLAQLEGKLDEAKQYLEESMRVQIELDGDAMDETIQYLDEVNHAINVRL